MNSLIYPAMRRDRGSHHKSYRSTVDRREEKVSPKREQMEPDERG